MTAKEALNEILNVPDGQVWYKVTEDEKERTWIRVTALRILDGTSKPETMRRFFNMFGYELTTNTQITKIKEKCHKKQ